MSMSIRMYFWSAWTGGGGPPTVVPMRTLLGVGACLAGLILL